eukprot:TRINITY_DN13317_c0_g1_i1.p1 TRINITY_DN13317_c0_g1~~TRINITY_DN13317_c0_g1_i1.p1  ORF type:complete len:56 (+),score=3.06 TRINITY_DN13317_c0_g1_i1:52-219(+)
MSVPSRITNNKRPQSLQNTPKQCHEQEIITNPLTVGPKVIRIRYNNSKFENLKQE